MLRLTRYFLWMAALAALSTFPACQKWDEHTGITDPLAQESLLYAIDHNSQLTRFRELLNKTGYDTLLAGSKNYTVWAPTDAALQNLDPALAGDTARLKQFVANHIAFQSYTTGEMQVPQRIRMLNGKRNTFEQHRFGEAVITEADKFYKNGVLHLVNRPVPVLMNTWEFLNAAPASAQQAYLLSLNYQGFDPATAVQTGVDPVTGAPVYQPGTGMVLRNGFTDRVQNLKNEDRQYTFFMLEDAAYEAETGKLKRFFATGTADSTNNLAAWHLVRDLAFEGLYAPAQLPDTLVSRFGVKVPIDKNAISAIHRTSNGIIYVMKKMDFRLEDKVPAIVIQGENPRSFSHDRRNNTFYRIRQNPQSGSVFNDILVQNHATASFHINYRANNVYSARYKVYWVAVNDFASATHQQRLVMDLPTNTTLPYVTVQPGVYHEVLLGEINSTSYRDVLDLFLVSANSTNNTLNPLVLDYIKLVPVY